MDESVIFSTIVLALVDTIKILQVVPRWKTVTKFLGKNVVGGAYGAAQ